MGALDGKHVAIRKPPSSGSLYHNYKGFFSIVLLALVDTNCRFLWIDVGGMGHMSDAQMFNDSGLKECIDDETTNFPRPEPLPYNDADTPYFLLGDDADSLRKYFMKPYSRRGLAEEELVFYYRISRARRVVENAFGILANRWQCLLSTRQQRPDVVRSMVEAAVCLHNIMRTKYNVNQDALVHREDDDHKIIPALFGQCDGSQQRHCRGKETAKLYFNSDVGQVA
ncbi:putative nuclease HARBI1 [Haliotis rubra]|uniref:putative nuclease HARBI1 n=1 Tax=Haliotis rubra TaxID=36100 RepID=UPI001EE62E56|nr:putative nuclease HARBI1 [Haliotis rubra]